jgi:hypothetical protein
MKSLSCMRVAAVAFVLAAVCVVPSLHAQTDYSDRFSRSQLTVGPAVGVGASMSLFPAQGMKIGPIFASHFGVDATWPLSPSIGATIGMGIESRGTSEFPDNRSEAYVDSRFSYFHITPGFMFSSFYLGMNFGLPMGASFTTAAGTTDIAEADEDKLNVLMEPRIGVVITVMDSMLGWLGITATTGVTLSELYDRGERPAGFDREFWGNKQNISLYVGSTFQLAIPGTGKK